MNVIFVKTVIGSEVAISTEKGTKLYDEMKKYLDTNQDFFLDFKGVEICVSPFIGFSIGQVFVEYGEDMAQKIVDNSINFKPDHKRSLDRCIRNFRRYSTVPAERISVAVDKMAESFADGSWRD
jgi:hypothetical protein